jgi:hypothetical protein
MFKKKKKDEDLFINAEEDWTQFDQAESVLDDEDFDLPEDQDEELLDDQIESDDPDENRYQQHLKLKKQDKIFNNTWNTGDGLSEDTFQSTSIKLDPGHTDSHLLDGSKYDQYLDKSIIERDLNTIVRGDADLSKLMDNSAESRKFTKAELNDTFAKICKLVDQNSKTTFISPIDVLDFVSMLAQLDFKRLFESLDYEHKEVLLLELNKKFGILDGKVKFKKLF